MDPSLELALNLAMKGFNLYQQKKAKDNAITEDDVRHLNPPHSWGEMVPIYACPVCQCDNEQHALSVCYVCGAALPIPETVLPKKPMSVFRVFVLLILGCAACYFIMFMIMVITQ